MSTKIKETCLFEPVKKWLEDDGYEVFPEVQLFTRSSITDVVGIRENKIVITVELKTSFSLKLIEQAYRNCYSSNYSYVCTNVEKSGNRISKNGRRYWVSGEQHSFARRLCSKLGIGVLVVKGLENDKPLIEEILSAKFHRKSITKHYLQACDEFRKKFNEGEGVIAGSANGGYLTSYKQTMFFVKQFLEKCGMEGATSKTICANVDHHYTGVCPEQSIAQAVRKWEMREIGFRKEGHSNIYFLRKFEKNTK